MSTADEMAPFLRDALMENEGAARDESAAPRDGSAIPRSWDEQRTALDRAMTALGSGSPPSAGSLLDRLDREGGRYAPFVERVAKLFGVDEDGAEDVLRPEGWRMSLLPGMHFKELSDPRVPSERASLLIRFRPGFRYPNHRHLHTERVLLLEGGYTDSSGKRYVAGDVHEMPPSSEHSLRADSDGPCVIAVLSERKLLFRSPLLRAWARLVGW